MPPPGHFFSLSNLSNCLLPWNGPDCYDNRKKWFTYRLLNMIIYWREHRKFIPPCLLWTKNKGIFTIFFMNNKSVFQESWQSPRCCISGILTYIFHHYLSVSSSKQKSRSYLIWFLWSGVSCRTRVMSGRLDPCGREAEWEVLRGSSVGGERRCAHAGINVEWHPAPPPRCVPSCSSLPADWSKIWEDVCNPATT
jgi:hypothetical protein